MSNGTRNVAPRQVVAHGLVIEVFQPGAFYQCVEVGGWSDASTGIHIPGAKAIVDPKNKHNEIINFIDVPDPIQLPTHKRVLVTNANGKGQKEMDVDFDANDENPMHQGFLMALQTGIIRIVPQETMEAKYPEAWAKRQEKYLWLAENVRPKKTKIELLTEAEDAGRFAPPEEAALETAAAQVNARTEALGISRQPPPPPPPKGPPPPPPPR